MKDREYILDMVFGEKQVSPDDKKKAKGFYDRMDNIEGGLNNDDLERFVSEMKEKYDKEKQHKGGCN